MLTGQHKSAVPVVSMDYKTLYRVLAARKKVQAAKDAVSALAHANNNLNNPGERLGETRITRETRPHFRRRKEKRDTPISDRQRNYPLFLHHPIPLLPLSLAWLEIDSETKRITSCLWSNYESERRYAKGEVKTPELINPSITKLPPDALERFE
jgi:hypothetical protein